LPGSDNVLADPAARDVLTVRGMLAIVAIAMHARTYARLLIEFSEEEAEELLRKAFGV
jgi:hypothetical protein